MQFVVVAPSSLGNQEQDPGTDSSALLQFIFLKSYLARAINSNSDASTPVESEHDPELF